MSVRKTAWFSRGLRFAVATLQLTAYDYPFEFSTFGIQSDFPVSRNYRLPRQVGYPETYLVARFFVVYHQNTAVVVGDMLCPRRPGKTGTEGEKACRQGANAAVSGNLETALDLGPAYRMNVAKGKLLLRIDGYPRDGVPSGVAYDVQYASCLPGARERERQ